jgi:hypothetical protein
MRLFFLGGRGGHDVAAGAAGAPGTTLEEGAA